MKILVIGSGGREHAIIRKLKKDDQNLEIVCLPGNGGIAKDAECVNIKATDLPAIVRYAKENRPDFVVVAPDDPLVAGLVDLLEAEGFPCFGPNKAAARLEGSKVFSKAFMKKHGIPTAAYETFDNPQAAIDYLANIQRYPVVIKVDGLAFGKGVIIADNFKTAKLTVLSMMEDKIFGESGSRVVIEECLQGPEVSVLAFCDGNVIVPMVSSTDHKRALDGDRGLNTGGMGTIAPSPYYTKEMEKLCGERVIAPTMAAMKAEGIVFKGCLYFGLMLTEKGPYVIEYNCRFGDPETQSVLPLLKSNLLTVMQAVAAGKLAEIPVEFEDKAACCVIMASKGYPQPYKTGYAISGLEDDMLYRSGDVYHAGTALEDGKLVTAGGRVLGVTAVGDTLNEAIEKAYERVGKIKFDKAFYRKDIGKQLTIDN